MNSELRVNQAEIFNEASEVRTFTALHTDMSYTF